MKENLNMGGKYSTADFGKFSTAIDTNQQCSIHDGILRFPEIMETEVKTGLNDVNMREVRIIPQGSGYTVEIVYLKEIADIPGMNPEFQSANGKLIHADLNGSYNIIKKAIPELKWNGIEGIGLYPRSLSIRQMITSKGGC